MQAPTLDHCQAAKRVLRYLKGSIDQGLLLQPSSSYDLEAYTDLDWAGCPTTRRSTAGFCIYMGKSLIINPVLHSRIKHVEIDVCFVKEKVTSGALRVQYVSTIDQNTDLFTKALSTPRLSMLKSKLNVVSPPINLHGGNSSCINNQAGTPHT
ncbi:hypothetical protein LIER_42734 [Lithospermum erythrorhizon]|uniref:Uncharacterized protein n=1 Tax=Lithospermum erythrorhizon TaxID=34254 RepID=A0AAV3NY17_LITER